MTAPDLARKVYDDFRNLVLGLAQQILPPGSSVVPVLPPGARNPPSTAPPGVAPTSQPPPPGTVWPVNGQCPAGYSLQAMSIPGPDLLPIVVYVCAPNGSGQGLTY